MGTVTLTSPVGTGKAGSTIDTKEIFERLTAALTLTQLPTEKDGPRIAAASEFMMMHAVGKNWFFKHADSRNYIELKADGTLHILKTGEPFKMGTFDKF